MHKHLDGRRRRSTRVGLTVKFSPKGDVAESYCTYLSANELTFAFGIMLNLESHVGDIVGTIDRVTGVLSAGQIKSENSYTRWLMTCSPTKQKF